MRTATPTLPPLSSLSTAQLTALVADAQRELALRSKPVRKTVADLMRAFHSCPGANHNLVHVGDMQDAAGMEREPFLALLRQAREEGIFVLKIAEGRHGLTERDQAAMIFEPDCPGCLWVAKRL